MAAPQEEGGEGTGGGALNPRVAVVGGVWSGVPPNDSVHLIAQFVRPPSNCLLIGRSNPSAAAAPQKQRQALRCLT